MGKKGNRAVRVKQVGPKGPPINPMADLAIPPEEMINLPPQPDRKYQVIWPIQETFSMDLTGFQVIYPSYMDKTKTVRQGRRISTEQAVDKPTVMDISQGLQKLQIRHSIQPYKGYSRDVTCQWDNPGRVLVDPLMRGMNKKKLMLELAEMIPSLPTRIERLAKEEQERIEEEKAAAAAAAAAKQSAAARANTSAPKKSNTKTSTSNKKKQKGKKKK